MERKFRVIDRRRRSSVDNITDSINYFNAKNRRRLLNSSNKSNIYESSPHLFEPDRN